ncbi:MAG: hypothetical protein M5U09_29900 [Gammaproteobacteria bacterium]|nr:hypothetical protein [Gammaproteobacteria bacterium]
MTRWLLPLMVPRELPLGRGLAPVHRLLISGGGALSGTRRWTLILIPAALAAVHFSNTPVRDLDVDSLSPIGEERRAEDRDLRADLGFWYGGKLAVVAGDSAQAVLERSEALAGELDTLIEEGVITRYDMAATFLPSRARQNASWPRFRAKANCANGSRPPSKIHPFARTSSSRSSRRPSPRASANRSASKAWRTRRWASASRHCSSRRTGCGSRPCCCTASVTRRALDGLNRRYGDSEVLYLNIKERAEDIPGDSGGSRAAAARLRRAGHLPAAGGVVS